MTIGIVVDVIEKEIIGIAEIIEKEITEIETDIIEVEIEIIGTEIEIGQVGMIEIEEIETDIEMNDHLTKLVILT